MSSLSFSDVFVYYHLIFSFTLGFFSSLSRSFTQELRWRKLRIVCRLCCFFFSLFMFFFFIHIYCNLQCNPVGWGHRIQQLHLCRGDETSLTSVLNMTFCNMMVRISPRVMWNVMHLLRCHYSIVHSDLQW